VRRLLENLVAETAGFCQERHSFSHPAPARRKCSLSGPLCQIVARFM
jgi:hypothetical protein